MILFQSDYTEGCVPEILERLQSTNYEQTTGYGMDDYCESARRKIQALCGGKPAVHFLVGGTQANFTVIASALRPYQGVLCADTGHIHVHETGAVEATGHKCLALASHDGKISADQVRDAVYEHLHNGATEHTVQPKMVYISFPTELGTRYSKQELTELSDACRENGLYLFLDGARLGYGLEAPGNDLTMTDIAGLCDVFYIGGTKVGALFGEAVVITNPALDTDFRYMIKQCGGMLAKGRLLGLQFDTLFTDDLYFRVAAKAIALAQTIRECLADCGIPCLVENDTNQIFPVFDDAVLERLSKRFGFTDQGRVDAGHRAVRICTSWATTQEQVASLCEAIRKEVRV